LIGSVANRGAKTSNYTEGQKMAENRTVKIVAVYEKSNDYEIVPASGVWGGLNPQGDLVANFFVEQNQLPEEIEITVGEDGRKLGEVPKYPRESHTTRRLLQVGVVMRPEIAKSIGEWFIEHGTRAQAILSPSKGE